MSVQFYDQVPRHGCDRLQEQMESMRHYSREYLKRKAVERWENEGGKICADEATLLESNELNEGEPVRESQSSREFELETLERDYHRDR